MGQIKMLNKKNAKLRLYFVFCKSNMHTVPEIRKKCILKSKCTLCGKCYQNAIISTNYPSYVQKLQFNWKFYLLSEYEGSNFRNNCRLHNKKCKIFDMSNDNTHSFYFSWHKESFKILCNFKIYRESYKTLKFEVSNIKCMQQTLIFSFPKSFLFNAVELTNIYIFQEYFAWNTYV